MKKTLRNIFIIVVVLLSLSFIAYKTYWTGERKKIVFTSERIIQATPVIEKYFALNFMPSKLTELNDSVLLLEDQQQRLICLLNKSDGTRREIFRQQIDSSNRHARITNIDVDANRIFVSDSKSRRITTYDFNGRVQRSDSINFPFSRSVQVQGDSIFLFQRTVINQNRTSLVFTLINIKTGKITADNLFDNVLPKQENSDMIYDGFFAKHDTTVFYVCYQENRFFSFDRNMKLVFESKLIYHTPSPLIRKVGNMKYVESSYIGVASVSADNKMLFILSNIGDSRHGGKRILDVYAGKTGQYLYSAVAPNNDQNEIPLEIYAGTKDIYFLYNNGIARTKR
jgi:hypothetical protein